VTTLDGPTAYGMIDALVLGIWSMHGVDSWSLVRGQGWPMEWHQAFWSPRTRGNIWRISEEGRAPVAGDQVVDEDQHLELGQLVPRAGVHAAPKWQEGVRPRRNLHSQTTRRGVGSSANCSAILFFHFYFTKMGRALPFD
jgi:hypothetical protein